MNEMDEKRKNLIIRQLMKAHIRETLTFKDLPNLKRNIGNSLKKPEITKINATEEEITDLTVEVLDEVYYELTYSLRPNPPHKT